MENTVLFSCPGVSIELSETARTMTHYTGFVRGDGTAIHDFHDLGMNPELIADIPEASKYPDMVELLRSINLPAAPLVSISCDSGSQISETLPAGRRHITNGYVAVSFRDAILATDKVALDHLARRILRGTTANAYAVVHYDMIIEPLKHFFGIPHAYCLSIEPFGFGSTLEESVTAYNSACSGLAKGIAAWRHDNYPLGTDWCVATKLKRSAGPL